MNTTTQTMVWIRTTFTGFHRYKDAPEKVKFLRDWHRHVFHVRLGVTVEGLNREVEFFDLKERVNQFLIDHYEGIQFEASCEQIAAWMRDYFDACVVEVSEDGENGATVMTVNNQEELAANIEGAVDKMLAQVKEECDKIMAEYKHVLDKIEQLAKVEKLTKEDGR